MKKVKVIIFLVASVFPLFSFASECFDNKIEFDICKYANEFAKDLSKSLPMDLNKSMSIESVAAIENLLLIIVQLRYDREHIEKLYKRRGLSFSDYKESLNNSLDSMCLKDDPVGAFIKLGGQVRYIYRFSDGERFLSIKKTNCEISAGDKTPTWEYKKYQNKRFDFKVSYPHKLFTAMGESDNEDGQAFVNYSDTARITTYGTLNTNSCDLEKMKDHEISLDYLRETDNTVVYSGIKKDIVIYEKSIKESDRCLILFMHYPIGERELYDDIAADVAESFSPSRPEAELGIQQAEEFLNAIKDRDFEEVYSSLIGNDGRSATIRAGQISFDTLEEFKSVYDDVFAEPFIDLIDSGLKPECCVGAVNYGFENRVYWGNKDLSVVFFFGKDGYTEGDQRQVLRLTNNLIPNPSFSCEKAKSVDEKNICNDVWLSELDQKLTEEYVKAKRYLNRDSYENLIPTQRVFIENRKDCGSDRECLANKMQERVEELSRLIENEVRDVEEGEVSINDIGASLNGPWKKDKTIDTNVIGSGSEEIRRNNTKYRVKIDWPTALFEYQIGRDDATIVSVTQTCSLINSSKETLAQAYKDSVPAWGSGGGGFDWLGMQGYYFILEFQDQLLNSCGYLVVSGRQSSGFELFLVKPDIEDINTIRPMAGTYSSGEDVLVSIYGVGSFSKRKKSESSLGLPNVAVKMKRAQ